MEGLVLQVLLLEPRWARLLPSLGSELSYVGMTLSSLVRVSRTRSAEALFWELILPKCFRAEPEPKWHVASLEVLVMEVQ